MCKTWMVLSVARVTFNDATNKLGVADGSTQSVYLFHTLEGAQRRAAELARGGYIGIVYESREFHLVKPVPVVIERTECCDTK